MLELLALLTKGLLQKYNCVSDLMAYVLLFLNSEQEQIVDLIKLLKA